MSFAIWTPPAPVAESGVSVHDDDRIIGTRMCWDIEKVVQAVKDKTLTIVLSRNAQHDVLTELSYSNADIVAFFENLGPHRYVNSQWCLPPQAGNHHAPYPADSYAMGFDKVNKVESQQRQPYTYIKFAVNEVTKKVLIFSMHPSR
jgi:hypothetical protein